MNFFKSALRTFCIPSNMLALGDSKMSKTALSALEPYRLAKTDKYPIHSCLT